MNVIDIHQPYQFDRPNRPSCVALGNFDGLHLGHCQVVTEAIKQAQRLNIRSGVMTFSPHPQEVLQKMKEHAYLTPLAEKLRIFESMGVDDVYVVHFTIDLSKWTAGQFIHTFLLGLCIQHVVTGFDFRFGQYGRGSAQTLQDWSMTQKDFSVSIVPSINKGSLKVSSSRIKELLANGQIVKANEQLNRPYLISGSIIHGEKRGRTIGFPTANLFLSDSYVLPKEGVYAVYVYLNANKYAGVLNLGTKPTFHDSNNRSIEIHILDFDKDIYGTLLQVEFIQYIRSERKFSGPEELIEQINRDIRQARTILNEQ